MTKLIKPTEKYGSQEEVERWYKKEKDKTLSMKLNAIRLLMIGKSQKEISEILRVSASTIRLWRKEWNLGGLEELRNNYRGSESKITDEMRVEIENIIDIKKEINGKIVTAKLVVGHIKKNII